MTDIKDLILAARVLSITHAKLLEKKMKKEQELERLERQGHRLPPRPHCDATDPRIPNPKPTK